MKRTEWPSSQKPRDMLYALLKAKKSGRKFRLFACSCCRRVWPLLSDPRSRHGIEVAEACADGLSTDSLTAEAFNAASAAYSDSFSSSSGSSGGEVASGTSQANREAAQAVPVTLLNFETPENAQRHASIASYQAITATSLAESHMHPADVIADYAQTSIEVRESSVQADWLRCIFGYPFRRQSIQPAWCTPTVVAMAQATYDSRSLPTGELEGVRLAVLADALQEAGCTDTTILSHCREPRPHVRGCWVVDLILGKK